MGERPQAGVFRGQRFLHPDLDFQIRFPDGWATLNTPQAVGAQSRRRDAAIFLSGAGAAVPPREAAEKWLAEAAAEAIPGEPRGSGPVKLAGADGGEAYRAQVYQSNGRIGLLSTATFFNHGKVSMSITSMALNQVARKIEGRYLSTVRSFRRMTPEQMRGFEEQRIHVVEARGGESLDALVERTGSIWNRNQVAVANARGATESFDAGERVKIAVSRPYQPAGGESLGGGPDALHELAAALLELGGGSDGEGALAATGKLDARALLLRRALFDAASNPAAEADPIGGDAHVGPQAAVASEGRIAQ